MLCYMPAPYPDELLYSVVARYIVHAGVKDTTAASHIFGRKMIVRVGLPCSLDVVSERTWPVWRLTAAEIADQLTLFPYYSRFMPYSRAMKCLDILRSNHCTGLPLRFGLSRSNVKLPKFLRFCKTCRENDLLKYGETYWCRSHQLAGVLVCPEHGERLIDTNALMQPWGFREYIDATRATADPRSENIDDTLSDQEAAVALKVAICCREILHGPVLQWPKEDLCLAYRQAAMERGFTKGPITLSHSGIEKAFVSYYGTLLSRLGCEVHAGVDENWLRQIVRNSKRSSFHPVHNALFQVFLEGVPVDRDRRMPFGFGPWKCPNRHASHKRPFPVRRAVYKKSGYGIEVNATCDCGLRFTFLRTSDTDPKLPVVDHLRHPNLTWQAEARLLRQCGLSEASIAERTHLSLHTVKSLLKKKQDAADVSLEQLNLGAGLSKQPLNKRVNLNNRSPEQIYQWRIEWLKLLDKVQSITQARRKNVRLYSKLLRYDTEWFYSVAKSRPEIGNAQQIDWAARDEMWSPMLRAAAEKIRSAVPLRKISRTAMIKEAGLDPSAILKRLDRLPGCRASLDECSETRDDYRERRLCTAVTKACQSGEGLTRAQLLKRCNLVCRPLSPRVSEVVERLLQGSGN